MLRTAVRKCHRWVLCSRCLQSIIKVSTWCCLWRLLSLAGRPPPCISTWSSICVCVLISYKDISLSLLGLTLKCPFYYADLTSIYYWIKTSKVDPLALLLYEENALGALPVGMTVTVNLWTLFIRSEKVLCALFTLKNGEHKPCLKLEIRKLGCLPHRFRKITWTVSKADLEDRSFRQSMCQHKKAWCLAGQSQAREPLLVPYMLPLRVPVSNPASFSCLLSAQSLVDFFGLVIVSSLVYSEPLPPLCDGCSDFPVVTSSIYTFLTLLPCSFCIDCPLKVFPSRC